MFESTGKLEQFLWEQVSSNSEIFGAAWIESGKIRAQALRNDFDLFRLQQFITMRRSSTIKIIHFEVGFLVVIPVEPDAYLILETIRDFSKDYRDFEDGKPPFIYINPDMGFSFA